jgi:hypothetical protein
VAERPLIVRRPPVSVEPVRWWLALTLVAFAIALAPVPPWVVDQFYSRDMYPWLQTWLTTATNLLPIAVLDVLIIGVVVLMGIRARRIWLLARYRGIFDAVWEMTRRVIRFAAVVALMFLWTWGCNYRRLPLETALAGNQAVTPTVESLRNAVADANGLAARLRPTIVSESPSYDEIAAVLRDPMNLALEQLNRPALGAPGRPKFSLILSPYFTAAGINGMVNPLALEAIVQPDLLPFERAFVLAHEWAHLAGQADEAEASAVGWLACMNGTSATAYSASLYLIMEGVAALPPDDRRAAMQRVDPEVRSDLAKIAERMQRRQPVVQQAAERAYDGFLKANRVEDGTASYGRALTLILASPIYDALGSFRPNRRKPPA